MMAGTTGLELEAFCGRERSGSPQPKSRAESGSPANPAFGSLGGEARDLKVKVMAGTTGLEPAASAVTGQRSNQLNYVPACGINLVQYNS